MGHFIERHQPRHQGLSAREWFHLTGAVPAVLIEPLLNHHAKLINVLQQARDLADVEDEPVCCGGNA